MGFLRTMSSKFSPVPCIIPARGGSKGLARKNIIELARKPLIAWSIEAALQADSISSVFVSTEDEEIADVAHQFGAQIIFRPIELAQDETSSEAVLLDALEQWQSVDLRPEFFVFLQCTSPMTSARDIDGAVALFRRENADSVVPVTQGDYFLWTNTDDGSAKALNHDIKYRQRRQERAPEYRENGSIYVVRSKSLVEEGTRYCGKIILYEIPLIRSFEIDDAEDLKLLQYVISSDLIE
jgi:CMP-N,N'-diacetyllegionaminic acid synthase